MNYSGINPVILSLQMELTFWVFTIVHRNNNWVVDAEHWSRISENIHIDPLLAEYSSLAQTLYKNYAPPNDEISQDTLPGFRKKMAHSSVNIQ